MGLFHSLLRKKTISREIYSEISARGRALFELEFDSYVDLWNIDRKNLYDTINKVTEARLLLVCYGEVLGEFCAIQVCRDFELLSDLDILTRNFKLSNLGFNIKKREAFLRQLWLSFDPMCQSNLDHEFRRKQKKRLLSNLENAFISAVRSRATFDFDGFFRFEQALDPEWLDLLRFMVDKNQPEVFKIVDRWISALA